MMSTVNLAEEVDEEKKFRGQFQPISHRKHRDRNQQTTAGNENKPLAKYSVLYLGAAIPSPNQHGIDSIQEPLSRRYPIDGRDSVFGIETRISIDTDGVEIRFVGDPSVILYYPIRSLSYCAGVRFAKQSQTTDEFSNNWRFVSLDSLEASQIENTQNPPIFAVTFRRTRFSPVDECHCFVAKNKHTALNLVEACYKAYHISDAQQDCSKVPLFFKVDNNGVKTTEIDNEINVVPAVDQEQTLEYQTSQESSGFFYKTDQVPIDCWQLWENHKNGLHRTSSDYSANSRPSNRRAHFASTVRVSNSSKMPSRSQLHPTSNSTEQLSQLTADPHTSVPDVFRVERIKDKDNGRDVYVRWLHDKPRLPKNIPSTQTANDDYPVVDQQVESVLLKETKRLALNSELPKKSVVFKDNLASTPKHHEHKKSKKKHRKHTHRESQIIEEFYEDRHGERRSSKTRISSRHQYDEIYSPPSPVFPAEQIPSPIFMDRQPSLQTYIEQQLASPIFMDRPFLIPSSSVTFPMSQVSYTYQTLEAYGPSNNMNPSAGYWYFTM